MNKCNICGGSVIRKGNYYICQYCHNRWEIDAANDIHAVDRANAWAALRDCDFERAVELFEEIILKDAKGHEAYFGRALAANGIIYVNDLSEHKKVPTCNNITEDVFTENSDVKKAISLAPKEIAESYKKQADLIDKIRIEWLEKASREPEYDVFISFKDSDREHGIERTEDSIDAQDLYNALIAEGYRVFFSRISLRDKISEQYEPYIYNAIKTAKIMIVFGEKPEYFNAVWIKNEWSRFKTRIEKGEKHKNSLVVVYKNMNPGDLPAALKLRQCLNASDMTFLSGLNKHIKRVIEESKNLSKLDKIKVTGGQISKKESKISHETLKTREIGEGAVTATSITEKQQLELVLSYLKSSQWEDARPLLDNILFDNPSYAEAIWLSLYIKHRVNSDKDLFSKLNHFGVDDLGAIEKTLNCAEKAFAEEKLEALYDSYKNLTEEAFVKLLKVILPFNFKKRLSKISDTFNLAIEKSHYEVFSLLLSSLDAEAVDTYIARNADFAEKTKNPTHKKICTQNILSVDAGNAAALKEMFLIQWESADTASITKAFEENLKYSKDIKKKTVDILEYAQKNIKRKDQSAFIKQALKYYPDDLKEIEASLIKIAEAMIEGGFFDEAESILRLILVSSPNNATIYLDLCLIKTKSKSVDKIVKSHIPLKPLPEYTKYLTLVDEATRQKFIALAKKQTDRTARAARLRIVSAILIAVALAVGFLAGYSYKVLVPNSRYNKATIEFEYGNYAEALEFYKKLGNFKDSKEKLVECCTQIYGSELLVYTYDDCDYLKIKNGTVKQVKGAEMPTNLIIPDVLNGEIVTKIGKKAFKGAKFETVKLPDNLEVIEKSAFKDCVNLTALTIPAKVTTLEKYLFRGCELLETLTVAPENTKYHSLENCIIETETKTLILGCGGSTIPADGKVTAITDYAFRDCLGLREITIPFEIKKIPAKAFKGCKNLTRVSFENTANWNRTGLSSYKYGWKINVSDPSKNAEILKEAAMAYKYWYNEKKNILGF